MNERIRELAKEAGAGEWGDSVVPAMMDIEKFAELIVREIMQELFINGYEDAFDHLNEHFGVEE
jgi:hypothetical protein